jgi:glucose repression regulatory protein TUP1
MVASLSPPKKQKKVQGMIVKELLYRYEEEIGRLRQQLDQARAGHPPLSSGSVPQAQQSHPSQQHPQPTPPNIGPASNLFGGKRKLHVASLLFFPDLTSVIGIMNSQGNTQGPPGLVAPPQMVDPSQPQGQQQQHMGYPNSPQPPSSFSNGSSAQNGPPPPQQQQQGEKNNYGQMYFNYYNDSN